MNDDDKEKHKFSDVLMRHTHHHWGEKGLSRRKFYVNMEQ
jgi:hypothetical protein